MLLIILFVELSDLETLTRDGLGGVKLRSLDTLEMTDLEVP